MQLISLIHFPYVSFLRDKLNGVDLSRAFLFKVMLNDSDLSNASLSEADLSSADLSGAILIHNKYEKSINKNTKFDNAVIDNAEYIKYLHSNGGQNIPNEIKSKSELRSVLEKRVDMDENKLNHILNISELQ
jgi:uncharacterized protein YjbI with pentapeptide repeats